METNQILISIEGNIGAGKSFLLSKLRENPEYVFIDEPLELWESLKNDDKNLLENFYENPQRWGYTFQNCALISRYLKIKEAMINNPDKKIFITERCLETDYNIFAKMLYDDKVINEMEHKLYKMWYQEIIKNGAYAKGIIYVSTDERLCSQRIKSRGRRGESKISDEYLLKLEQYHKNWLSNLDKRNILSINSDENDKAELFINQFKN